MHWKTFFSATLKEDVCTELRIRIHNEFFLKLEKHVLV